jgi:hypothetical protein
MKFAIYRVLSSLIFRIWDFGRIREYATGVADHGKIDLNFPHAKTFQTSPHMFNLRQRNLRIVKVYFFGKGPSQGQIPGLLDHGSEIPITIL